MERDRRGFGQITKLPSGRFRARYTGPDTIRHAAPFTFETRGDAEAWLVAERRLVTSGDEWIPPKVRSVRSSRHLLFGEYAQTWLAGRTVRGRPLAERTREHYRKLLDGYILPAFADVPLRSITPDMVDHWYAVT